MSASAGFRLKRLIAVTLAGILSVGFLGACSSPNPSDAHGCEEGAKFINNEREILLSEDRERITDLMSTMSDETQRVRSALPGMSKNTSNQLKLVLDDWEIASFEYPDTAPDSETLKLLRHEERLFQESCAIVGTPISLISHKRVS